jgi:hypothetical protein
VIESLLTRPCTIIHRSDSGEIDAYGDAVPTEDTVETYCEIQQLDGDERPVTEGQTSRDTFNAWFPIDQELDTSDAVVIDGVEYQVSGNPWRATTGAAGLHHVAARLVRGAAGSGPRS